MNLIETEVRASPIDGLGCFTKHPIPSRTVLWRFDGSFDISFSYDSFNRLPSEAIANIKKYCYVSKITGDYILCADDARFMNHSSSPNIRCYLPTNGSGNELECVAIRDISGGEEITCDYAEFDAESVNQGSV